MIFGSNTTSLGIDRVAMAEGYDCSYGAALALVEGARSDYAMFRAMLDIDAREIQIQQESSGMLRESSVMALAEAASSGIWNKIKELFKKLAEKLKSIFHTFIAKINSLFMDGKKLADKYGNELLNREDKLNKLEVKWIAYTDVTDSINPRNPWAEGTAKSSHDEDEDKRIEYYLGCSPDIFDTFMNKTYITGSSGEAQVDMVKIGDNKIGGVKELVSGMKEYPKALKNLEKDIKKLVDNAAKYARDAGSTRDKALTKYGKSGSDDDKDSLDNAKKVYDMASAYQTAVLRRTNWGLNAFKDSYKYLKAAFMKCVTVSDKKLEESAIVYANAVAEAAEQEVDDVIDAALSKEELSKINNASLNVKDADVSDDPGRLTYGPDYYTDNQSYVRTAGSIDTSINSKEESAFFGRLFY